MESYREHLNRHYGQDDLCGLIRWECEKLGLLPGDISRADLRNLDEIHIRGLEATLELGKLAAIGPDYRVLDVGCGLGGPARTLTAEFGCDVVGLDIVSEFIEAANMITEWVGLSDRVSFREGDMRAMPFPAADFDLVTTFHTVLNVEEKEALITEIGRVLKPGGGLLVYEVCGEDDRKLNYPVPWADGPEISFLVTADRLRRRIAGAGFTEVHWSDATGKALDWFDGMAAGLKPPEPRRMGPNVGLVLGPDAGLKSRNLQRNLREGRIQVVQGYFVI